MAPPPTIFWSNLLLPASWRSGGSEPWPNSSHFGIKQSFCPLRESLIRKKKIVTDLGFSKVTCTSAVPHVGGSLSVNHLSVPKLPGPRGTAGFLESPKPPQLLSLGHAYVLPQEQGRVEGSSLLLPNRTAFQDSEPSGRMSLGD